jgi:hypothetical protein
MHSGVRRSERAISGSVFGGGLGARLTSRTREARENASNNVITIRLPAQPSHATANIRSDRPPCAHSSRNARRPRARLLALIPHTFSLVDTLRIAHDVHLEGEENLVLPLVRQRSSEARLKARSFDGCRVMAGHRVMEKSAPDRTYRESAMPQCVQFPDAIEPLVQFIEETPPGEILDRTLDKLRAGVPTQTMLTASALAVARSTEMPPGHHGGPLHPMAGLYAVSKLVERLEGEQRFVPVLQHVALTIWSPTITR